jgi:LacI family transcriptional regulator
MTHPNKPATLHDVAKMAGVSYQTVSRVVNNSPHVSKKTRIKVQKAIESLDYRSNQAARSLITRQSQTLQVITPETGLYKQVHSILITAKQLGYNVILSVFKEPFELDELRFLLDDLSARVVDGFMFMAPQKIVSSEDLVKLARGRPFVQLGADPGPETPSVVFDQVMGTQLALQHLYELGHRQIAEIRGPQPFTDAQVRHDTYLNFMQSQELEAGLGAEGNFMFEGGYQAANRLLESGRPFTAIFCANDHMALGALRALNERKLRVPEDVSLVGFDDEPFACYLTPPLTTVRQDYPALGKQAVEYLVAMIKDRETAIHQRVLYPQLVIRKSTAVVA